VPPALMMERKLLGRFQHRYGPNRTGPYGAMQPAADILKLLGKEAMRPTTAHPFLYWIAPALSVIAALGTFALIPFGEVVEIWGEPVGLYGFDSSIGVLAIFALGAISFYGLLLGGFASGSKYAYLGAMRAAAQLISYEVSMGLALIGVIMISGSLSVTEIAAHQVDHTWFLITQPVGFLVFTLASMAETNRAPFDLMEADTELVAGYMTEYGGGGFASYYAAEYVHLVVAGGIISTFFLGAWGLPFGIDPPTWVDPFVVLVKTFLVVGLMIWIRATLPRLRYDQLMSFGWKILLPLATLNALVTAIVVVLV